MKGYGAMAWCKLFDTLMVFLKYFLDTADDKKTCTIFSLQRVKGDYVQRKFLQKFAI